MPHLGVKEPAVHQRDPQQVEDGHLIRELELVEIREADVDVHPGCLAVRKNGIA